MTDTVTRMEHGNPRGRRLITSVVAVLLTLVVGVSPAVATTPGAPPPTPAGPTTTTSTTTTTTTSTTSTTSTSTTTTTPAASTTTTAEPTTTAPTTTVAPTSTTTSTTVPATTSTLQPTAGPITPTATAGGWTTTASAPASVVPGQVIRVPIAVSATTSQRALVNVEFYIGSRRVRQLYWDNQTFTAGVTRGYSVGWTVPTNTPAGTYTVKIGIHAPAWGPLVHWNDNADTFRVVGWSARGTAPGPVARGSVVRVPVSVTAGAPANARVLVEFFLGTTRYRYLAWSNQSFAAGETRNYSVGWTVPSTVPLGTYTVRVTVTNQATGAVLARANPATSFAVTAPSWRLTATPPATAAPGQVVRIPFAVTAPSAANVTVTGEILYGSTVRRRVSWTGQPFTAGVERRYSIGWTIPTTLPQGTYTVRLTISTAAGAIVARAPVGSFTLTSAGRFGTLPPGSALPTDAECAARVRRTTEVRPDNTTANQTVGTQRMSGAYLNRVTGNFRGTTDEIIQWASCKWGFDEDVIRAQAAVESWWNQDTLGDWGTTADRCVPGHGIGVDGRPGECPETYGIMQTRYPYMPAAFPSAINSTAFNIDTGLAFRRRCFEGADTWLNDVERGRQYVAGDLWGCVGTWFAGRWYTNEAVSYINKVQGYLADRVWESGTF